MRIWLKYWNSFPLNLIFLTFSIQTLGNLNKIKFGRIIRLTPNLNMRIRFRLNRSRISKNQVRLRFSRNRISALLKNSAELFGFGCSLHVWLVWLLEISFLCLRAAYVVPKEPARVWLVCLDWDLCGMIVPYWLRLPRSLGSPRSKGKS